LNSFYITFIIAGTVVLVWSLGLQKALPQKFIIGLTITFGAIVALWLTREVLLWCLERNPRKPGRLQEVNGTDTGGWGNVNVLKIDLEQGITTPGFRETV
jgi:hypothetical protein